VPGACGSDGCSPRFAPFPPPTPLRRPVAPPLGSLTSSVLRRDPTPHRRSCRSYGFRLLRPDWRVTGAANEEVSRFSCLQFLNVRGVYDYAGPPADSRLRRRVCCLPHLSTRSASRIGFSKLDTRPTDTSRLRFDARLAARPARLEARWFAVGSEVARWRAGHRPPLKLYVRFSRIQLSRRLTLPGCNRRDQLNQIHQPVLAVQLGFRQL